LVFNLAGINDLKENSSGIVTAKLMDAKGNVVSQLKRPVKLPGYQRTNIPVFLTLPQKQGGYLILSEFEKDETSEVLKSRRYIKVGEVENPEFWEVEP
jgi:hypothetical protein